MRDDLPQPNDRYQAWIGTTVCLFLLDEKIGWEKARDAVENYSPKMHYDLVFALEVLSALEDADRDTRMAATLHYMSWPDFVPDYQVVDDDRLPT